MFVNGRAVHSDYPVAFGDIVSVRIEEPQPEYPAQPGKLCILFEDEALIAIDKPAGMMVHPSRSRNTDTLANYLAYYYQTTGQKCAVHPVSRLDRDTFGVVLLAKNAHIHARLCQCHTRGTIEKTYHAAVYGAPPQPQGRITLPIARLSPQGMLRGVREDGQSACTDYRTLEETPLCTLLELHPRTGRTHQLRVHLAAVGCPILGDPQYGSSASQAFSLRCGYQYQQLCAVQLRFPHPLTDEPLTITSGQRITLPSV